ncbi:MAG TPA: hypothetical protein VKX49_30800 [Bryobacteraceae bacterium]|nr:hypothetical protein [Bryobacteraceae bacterium]
MAFCANCGAPVDGRFCQKCGAPVAGAAPINPGVPGGAAAPGMAPQAAAAGMSDNAAGAICYLFGFITGILFLVLAPYNQNRNVRFHAFQSIFLNIAWVVLWIAVTVLSIALHVIPVIGAIISILLGFCLWIGALVVWLFMMFKTYNGEKIVLPVIGPMAEKQAGM